MLDPGPDPAEAAAPATAPRQAAYRTGVVHQALLNLCALGLVVTVIPLVVLQIPDAVAWVVPPRVAAAAGVVAVVTERRTRTQAPNGAPRVLAASWAAVMVAGLAAAPELMRHRVGAGDWVVAVAMACTPVRGAGGIPDHG